MEPSRSDRDGVAPGAGLMGQFPGSRLGLLMSPCSQSVLTIQIGASRSKQNEVRVLAMLPWLARTTCKKVNTDREKENRKIEPVALNRHEDDCRQHTNGCTPHESRETIRSNSDEGQANEPYRNQQWQHEWVHGPNMRNPDRDKHAVPPEPENPPGSNYPKGFEGDAPTQVCL